MCEQQRVLELRQPGEAPRRGSPPTTTGGRSGRSTTSTTGSAGAAGDLGRAARPGRSRSSTTCEAAVAHRRQRRRGRPHLRAALGGRREVARRPDGPAGRSRRAVGRVLPACPGGLVHGSTYGSAARGSVRLSALPTGRPAQVGVVGAGRVGAVLGAALRPGRAPRRRRVRRSARPPDARRRPAARRPVPRPPRSWPRPSWCCYRPGRRAARAGRRAGRDRRVAGRADRRAHLGRPRARRARPAPAAGASSAWRCTRR